MCVSGREREKAKLARFPLLLDSHSHRVKNIKKPIKTVKSAIKGVIILYMLTLQLHKKVYSCTE